VEAGQAATGRWSGGRRLAARDRSQRVRESKWQGTRAGRGWS